MEILKKLRKQKGLSTAQVAKQIGYSQKSIENHENGTFLPKSDVLKKYAELYDVTISYLIDAEDKSILISEEEYQLLLNAELAIQNIRKRYEVKKSVVSNINNQGDIKIGILNDNHGVIGTNIGPISSNKDPESD